MRAIRGICWLAYVVGAALAHAVEPPTAEPRLAQDVLPLLQAHCVRCHGPAKREAKLDLSTGAAVARGGESGAIVSPGELAKSLLWQRVTADEMPPADPLKPEDKALLERWIATGATGLPTAIASSTESDHWAFTRLRTVAVPEPRDSSWARTPVDHFILERLRQAGLEPSGEAERTALVRRLSIGLTGLPPTPEETTAFLADQSPGAYERLVERYLASPHYGQRWAKSWLDAAGYADSNGYFNADTDRPLAYRYRDYVVRAFNADKPFDQFIVEQLAGDELAGFVPGQPATPEIIELLEATHFLRNGQDGTGESDGNPDEVRTDRYAALETTQQIVSTALLGLTMQCAKCHDHKFEPITQRDYYQLQSVFYPAFNIAKWLKPNERTIVAALPGETERWEERGRQIDAEIAALKAEFGQWARDHRPPTTVLFADDFDESGPLLSDNWTATAPGDNVPGGVPAVALDSSQAPAAERVQGALRILESGAAGDRWLSTRQAFDWACAEEGQWIQVTFDLVDNKGPGGRAPAERIAYLLALHDFNDDSPVGQGNVLIDGNPAGGAVVHLDYPGEDAKLAGNLGAAKYEPGHNYGVRITRLPKDKLRVEHLVDFVPEEKSLKLSVSDLPAGGFGFEYCCGRSFVVDHVVVERSKHGAEGAESTSAVDELAKKQQTLSAAVQARQAARGQRPGQIACVLDRSADAPEVFLLERGDYAAKGEPVKPAPLSALGAPGAEIPTQSLPAGYPSTGRRLAWARWLTESGSPQAALLARVVVNRIWQAHFGRGIVATADNLGTSGSPPTHPELLDYLANELVSSGWSTKAIHRLLVNSAVYRQSSATQERALTVDPDNRLLGRYSLRRLDAESVRDAVLAVSGQLDRQFAGSYVPTARNDLGEVIVAGDTPGALKRSLYLQQRRTQTLSLLNVFDAPSIVVNCVERANSTMPLQSLSLLNSEFIVTQAACFAERLAREAGDDPAARVARGYALALGRDASDTELRTATEFITSQTAHHAPAADAEQRAWADFCQMLLASNEFLYVE